MFQIMITVNLRQGKIQKLIQFEIVEPNRNQIFFHKMQMFAPLGIHLPSNSYLLWWIPEIHVFELCIKTISL